MSQCPICLSVVDDFHTHVCPDAAGCSALAILQGCGLHGKYYDTIEKAAEGVRDIIRALRADLHDPPHDIQCAVLRKLGVDGFTKGVAPTHQLIPLHMKCHFCGNVITFGNGCHCKVGSESEVLGPSDATAYSRSSTPETDRIATADDWVRAGHARVLERELQEAWHILNVLSANMLDDGPTWPRALEWLQRTESFRPENANVDLPDTAAQDSAS